MDNQYVGMVQSANPNPTLKWETKQEINVGVDSADMSMDMILEVLSNLGDLFIFLPIL